ncbi:hypothetical protein [Neobacillus sp. NPDC093127]|uniref:hypothetical protein n=1 Tax=Neobacillus sp. NPDC093127 TaxID=3364296 RepID=UPI00380CD9D9
MTNSRMNHKVDEYLSKAKKWSLASIVVISGRLCLMVPAVSQVSPVFMSLNLSENYMLNANYKERALFNR